MLEEIAGYLVEFHPELNISQKIIAFFRNMARKLGLLNSLTEQDIVYMAHSALRTAPESLLFPSENRGEIRQSGRDAINRASTRLAPNGKPSNLNALQYAQVRTKEFKKWFGYWENAYKVYKEKGGKLEYFDADDYARVVGIQSPAVKRANDFLNKMVAIHKEKGGFTKEEQAIYNKAYSDSRAMPEGRSYIFPHSIALDENFEPKVFYHGSSKFRGNKFEVESLGSNTSGKGTDKWFFFTTLPERANRYASSDPAYNLDANIIVNINNGIFDALEYGGNEEDDIDYDYDYSKDIFDPLISNGYLENSQIIPVFLNIRETPTDGKIWQQGYDDVNTDGLEDWAVVKNPNQIKSAIGNTGAFSSENNDIRYSIASDVKDFFTGRDAATQTLGDVLDSLNSGKPKTEKIDKQYWYDKIVTNFTDLSRPFDRWVMNTFNPIESQSLINAKDRAQGMKQAYEKEAMDKYGRPLADAIRDIAKQTKMSFRTAKDMAGYWMSAVYAPEANAWLLQKDQNAIDALEQEKFDAMAAFNALQNPSQSTRDKLDVELNRLDAEILKATDKRNKRKQAIERKEFIDLPAIREKLVELKKNRSSNFAAIQRLEEILEENVGLAGGMNDYTANELRTEIEKVIPKDLLKSAANPVYDLLKWKLQNDIKDGKVSQETVNTWNNSPNYVPLTGDPRTDDSVEDSFTTGSLNQQKDHALQGRTGSIAQNAIDAAFEQVEKSARYHGWNEFKDSLHTIYIGMLSAKMAEGLTQTQAIKEIREEHGIGRRAADTNIPPGDNDIVYRKDNKGFIYTIDNVEAMQALNQMTSEDVPTILKPFGLFTTLQAKLVTIGMVGFAPTNFIRDVLEKSENIRTRTVQGHNIDMNKAGRDTLAHGARLASTRLKMMAAVLAQDTPLGKYLTFDPNDSEVKQLQEYLRLGGNATYGEMLANNTKDLATQLGKLGTVTDKGWSTLLLYNGAFETISGFAAYRALIDQGVPPKIAATEALNLMNFRKRGRVLSPLRTLYMFLNPTAQAAHQLAKTLSTRRGQLRLAFYTVAAAILYGFLRGFDGDDEDELGFNRMDGQGNFSLYRNIHIPVGDGQYLKIPLGFGMQQLAWAHGVNLTRTYYGAMTVPEMLAESALLWQKATMPIAPAESSFLKNPAVFLAQTFAPQIVRPVVNVALDRNAFGAPLTNARYEKLDEAKALQGRKTTPQEYKDLAQFFAQHGMDVYPEQLRELVRGYFVGHVGDILKLVIENPNAEKLGREVVTPSLDRWITPNRDEMLQTNRYYRLRDEMNAAAVKRSTGVELTAHESSMAALSDRLKRFEARTRALLSQATKAEKAGQTARAEAYRKRADAMRQRYIDLGLKEVKNMV
jgi:hypothetical protein